MFNLYQLRITDCKITEVMDSSGEILHGIDLSSDGQVLDIGGWNVTINCAYPGRINVRYQDGSSGNGGKTEFKKSLTLAEGIIQLQYAPTMAPAEGAAQSRHTPASVKAFWVERKLTSTIMYDKFGITKIIRSDPNGVYDGYHTGNRDESCSSALCVLTDGQVEYKIDDEFTGTTYTASSLQDEELPFCQGPVECTVSGAHWAVVIEAFQQRDVWDSHRDVVLYTLHANPYLLSREMDKFLEQNGLAHFTDALEFLKFD